MTDALELTRRSLLAGFATIAMTAPLVPGRALAQGAGPGAGPGAPSSAIRGGRMAFGRYTDSQFLDPVTTELNADIWVLTNLFDTLLAPTSDGKGLQPGLATEWKWSDDRLSLELTLRSGVKFADGSDLTPADVVWSLDRARGTGAWKDLISSIKTVEPGEGKVTLRLSHPDATLLAALATFNTGIMPQKLVEAAPGATVWLHDYNLWLVPAYLRELRPDVRIAFFHHTYFPSADVFNVVPWRREILGSLLQCDYIGFHIPRQVENFVDVVRGAMPTEVLEREGCAPRFLTYGCAVGLDEMITRIRVGDRAVGLGAHPVGTDIKRIEKGLAHPRVRVRLEQIRREFAGRKLVLSVERLDYTKGTLEKLLAFERLLDEQPEQRGKVNLLMVCVPAAKEMTVYRKLQTQIEQAVGRINGRYAMLDWTPVRFFARALAFEEVLAHYAAADVMWITPLRDGLNLVAKEFVAAHGIEGSAGTLVLSEFAGAAAELKGAVLTNPHDQTDLVAGLRQALAMPDHEAVGRQRQLFETVRYYDVERWGQDFLAAVASTGSGADQHRYAMRGLAA